MSNQAITKAQAEVVSIEERIADLTEKLNAKKHLLINLESVFTTEQGAPLTIRRRNGDEQEASFLGAKDTGRGILVSAQVGEGFDAEVLRVPLSNVTFITAADARQELYEEAEADDNDDGALAFASQGSVM